MKSRMLAINEVEVNCNPVLYTCYGLGSCIGLFVTDRLNRLSAGAHIALPSAGSIGFPDAFQIMNEVLIGLKAYGSDLGYLRAKIAGGSRVYDTSLDIGEQNIHVVLQYMVSNKIFIAATDLGGHVARTTRFNSITGELEISTSDQKVYFI